MLYNFSDTSDVHNIDDDDDDLEVISESVSKSPKDKLTKYNHRNSVQISPKTTSKLSRFDKKVDEPHDDDDDEEEDNEVEDKGISVPGLVRDLGFSRRPPSGIPP